MPHNWDLAGRWKILMTLKQEKYNLTCRKDCRILGTYFLFCVYCTCGVNVFNVLVQCVFLHTCVNEWKSAFVLYLNAYCKRDTLNDFVPYWINALCFPYPALLLDQDSYRETNIRFIPTIKDKIKDAQMFQVC